MFYVYEWFIIDTEEIIYVGKGYKNRYKTINKNKLFRELYKRFKCNSRIVQYYTTEEEAFLGETERIQELKKIGQAVCNIKIKGYGGLNRIWTEERRKDKSINNPMKSQIQKKRMSTNNPMKNPITAKYVSDKKRKPVVINGKEYIGTTEASKQTGFAESSIKKWCTRGYDNNGNPCRYYNEEQKEYEFIFGNISAMKKVWVNDKLFRSVKEASKHLQCCDNHLVKCLKKNKLCKGQKVFYDNQQPSGENTDYSISEGSTTNE